MILRICWTSSWVSSDTMAPRRAARSKHLARIHQIMWSERVLQRPHQFQFDSALVALEFAALRLADAVLGAHAAAKPVHDIVDHAVDVRGGARLGVGAFASRHERIEVQVAVAHVTETNNA